MQKLFFGVCLIAMSPACGGSHGPADAGACVNEPACKCNDGRPGTKVCDADTHEYVMCECDLGSAAAGSDTGTRTSGSQGSAADGGQASNPGGGAAGRMSVPNRPQSSPDAGVTDAGRGNAPSGRGRGGRR